MLSNLGSEDPPSAKAAEGKMEEAMIPVVRRAERRESEWSALSLFLSLVICMDRCEGVLVHDDLMLLWFWLAGARKAIAGDAKVERRTKLVNFMIVN